MLSKLFGKRGDSAEDDSDFKALKEKISQMNLSELRLYAKGKLDGFEVSEEGLVLVLERLLVPINEKRLFLDADDDDTKLKKAFDLVISIARENRVSMKVVELIAKFIQTYEKLIKAFDQKHKEIYEDRLKKAVDNAMEIVEAKMALQNKMNMLQ